MKGVRSSIEHGLLLALYQLPRCSPCSLALHDRFSLRSLHPFIDEALDVDKDEVLAEILDKDGAGGVVPRPGAVLKGTAGSTQGAVQSFKLLVVAPMHGKGREEIEDQADGMERGPSYAIAQKVPYGASRFELHICPKIGLSSIWRR